MFLRHAVEPRRCISQRHVIHDVGDVTGHIKHSLYHDGNILRGFSSVQLTLRDFTFHRPHHVQTLKKTLELSYSQRILLRIRLTGLTVSSLLCKLKYFFSIFSFKVIIQSGFGNRLISCRLNKFWP